ncbi:hypothetical protein J7337_012569 [Fusarium musae]|uniref:Uncharacterized protein n=1 Tax=Fusarium musae TaxID=1042133 RepID=A0A9P8IKD8_9HYPO|nr:hypothetical protein J7337_012569 [Fusarium musae]KAG9495998.1 hypothetical protein J7337_012569 [Fusarium musae]
MANRIVFLTPKHLQKFIQDAESGTVYKNLAIMGVHDEDGETKSSEPPATREELTCLLTKAFTALAKGAGNPLGIVALKSHAEGHWTAPQIRAKAENESNFTGLGRLVQKCPRLQDFAYRFLGIPLPGLPELKGFQFPNWKILEYVSELLSLPKLNRLTLRFQLTKESIVLNLLKRTRHGGLFIGPMWLDPGYFKPIFEFCSSPESNMQKLEVRASLYQMGSEERGQIHFQRQPYDEDAECCAHLRREGEGVRRPIHFHSDPQTLIEVGTSFCNLLLNDSGAFDDSGAHTF